MGRLFWKFLLTFFLAFIVAGVGVGTAVWLRHNANQREAAGYAVDVKISPAFVAAAEAIVRHGGIDSLRDFLEKMHGPPFPPVYAVDDRGDELLNRHVDASVLQQAHALAGQGAYPGAVRRVTADNGKNYLLFMPTPEHGFDGPPPHGRGLIPPDPHGRPDRLPRPSLSILAGAIASLIFSAMLAWYFAKPIRSLRNAFDSLAQGNLDTRIGEAMGTRRDELADLGRDFDYMAAQIHSLVYAQQRLLHDVSHELRSPLARIQAAIGLAQQQPDKTQAMLERAEREAQRISDLVGELLLLSRLEAGVPDGDSHAFDIGDLLDEIVDDASFEAGQHQVSIRYHGIGETVVKGRSELLHRAIENVLRNAVQHCRTGGEVTVAAGFQHADGKFRLTIDDQGPGVADSDLAAIFQPFFRGGAGKAGSVGLGLAIAYRAIEAHGGSIQASNRPQGGLRIDIAIPFSA